MPDSADDLDPFAVFVYGTLKRGESREKCWPRPPLAVVAAEIRAELYDLGPYPAIREGADRVAGEIWRLRPEDLAETLRILDEIEDFRDLPSDLYVRREVVCRTADGEERAWSYFYAQDNRCTPDRRITPGSDGLCRWNG